MRTLSALAKAAIAAQSTDEVFLYLLKISDEDLDDNILLVNNTENITAGADTYIAFPFAVNLPDDVEDQLPTVELIVDAIDRSIIQIARELDHSPTFEINLVLASQPTTIETGPYEFMAKSFEYDVETLDFELGYEDIMNEAFPSYDFNVKDFPGFG